MKQIIFILILLVFSLPISAEVFDHYRWQNRIIVMTAPSQSNSLLQKQINLLTDDEGLADRDLVIFTVIEEVIEIFPDTSITSTLVKDIREEYDLSASDFEVILIGKDGGVKLRSTYLVAQEDFFALIDSMPMRQQEMRRSSHNEY